MARFSKTSQIKVGCIGYGGAFNMGKKHIEEMAATGMIPTAVAEIDESRLAVADADFPGIETYNSVAKMLKQSDVNMLAIITPHNTHADLALQCLRAGKDVVTEKPFAITTNECDRMIAEAKKRKLLVTAYHNRHWDGCILEALRQIKSGAIGDIIRIEAHMGHYAPHRDWWRASKTMSGGVLYDWGVHLLEYSLQLIDSEITEVSGFAKKGHWAANTKSRYGKDTIEDEGFATVRFKSGQWVNLTITTIDANPKPSVLEITGTKGSYLFDHAGWKLIQPKARGKVVTTTGKNPDGQQQKFYQNIADHLTGKADLVITPEWSRRPIHILDLACRSADQGRAVKAKHA